MFGGNREAMLAEQQLAYVLFYVQVWEGIRAVEGVDGDYHERYGRVYEGRGGEEDW